MDITPLTSEIQRGINQKRRTTCWFCGGLANLEKEGCTEERIMGDCGHVKPDRSSADTCQLTSGHIQGSFQPNPSAYCEEFPLASPELDVC